MQLLVNCSIMFTEHALLERPAAAKAAGFDSVEFWWPFAESVPSDRHIDRFITAIHDADVRLVFLNFAAGDLTAGDRGLVSKPGRSEEFRDNVEIAVGIGRALGVQGFNALYGNASSGISARQSRAIAVDNLAFACRAAQSIESVVLLEPLSGAPGYPLLTARDVQDVIDLVEVEADAKNLRLLADLYHLTVNGEDVGAALRKYAARIGHVQIADAPGRHEPGTGVMPLDLHPQTLSDIGYDGWIGLEYKPSGATVDSLQWCRDLGAHNDAGGVG